jgi:NRPS condensation-like uncharacterized protein
VSSTDGSGLSPAQQRDFERQLRAAGIDLVTAVAGAPRGDDAYLPLSFGQERLWFLDRLTPGSAEYHIAAAVRLRGELDVAVLRAALDELVRRHEALRTTIQVDPAADAPGQRVGPAAPVALDVLDVEHRPESEWRRLVRAEATRPFDVAVGPLLRTSLLRHSARSHTLLLTVHHIVFDAWSIGVVIEELARAWCPWCAYP